MSATRILQIGRIPLLLALSLAAGPPKLALVRAVARGDLGANWRPWLLLVTLAAIFMVAALAGRGSRHPPALLAIEALLAATIGVTPPTAWILWLGIGPITHAVGATSGNLFMPALAIAWLVIVAATGLRQRRESTTHRPAVGGAAVRRRSPG